MKSKVFAVIDTNVFVSALLSQDGFPYRILNYIAERNIIPLYDKRMICEYNEVFHYEKLKFSEEVVKDVLYTIIASGICVNDIEQTKEHFIDEDDIPFFEVKESTPEFGSYLVTGNSKHYPPDDYVVTPKELLAIMAHVERFVKFDMTYEEEVERLLKRNVLDPKYTSGQSALNLFYKDKEQKILNQEYIQSDPSIRPRNHVTSKPERKGPRL